MVPEVLQLLAVLALAFVPGLCFLGLFRLIDYMADDELLAQVERGEFGSGSPAGQQRLSVDPTAAVSAARGDETVTCRSCGARNRAGVSYCRHCLSEL